jgi:carbonic anhydrase
MDSRLDVEQVLGLDIGDAHVIRNGTFPNLIIVPPESDNSAGGRAVEALRSILISQQMLGTREIIIMHHVRQFHHPLLTIHPETWSCS